MTLSATELYRRGRAHLNAGQNAAARRVLAQAAERTDDPDLRARIAGSLAAVVMRQGDPATAERLCTEALQSRGLRPQTSAMRPVQNPDAAYRAADDRLPQYARRVLDFG